MAEYERTASVDAPAAELFAFLSEIRNLPRYFERMVAAEPGRGGEVKVEAVLSDGSHVAGDARFGVDDEARRIEWASEESGRDYRGWLVVTGESPSAVEVHISTAEVESEEVGRDLERTLDTIRRLVEDASSDAPGPG